MARLEFKMRGAKAAVEVAIERIGLVPTIENIEYMGRGMWRVDNTYTIADEDPAKIADLLIEDLPCVWEGWFIGETSFAHFTYDNLEFFGEDFDEGNVIWEFFN